MELVLQNYNPSNRKKVINPLAAALSTNYHQLQEFSYGIPYKTYQTKSEQVKIWKTRKTQTARENNDIQIS